MLTPQQANSVYSSLREKIVEHTFLSQLMREMWNRGFYTLEVSRAESDSFGYDVVFEHGPVVRHIQLKSKSERRPQKVSVSKTLALKPSGCVVAIVLTGNMEIERFYWFGNAPGQPLPALSGFKPTKKLRRDREGKKPPRQNHVDVPISRFSEVPDIAALIGRLFGTLASTKKIA